MPLLTKATTAVEKILRLVSRGAGYVASIVLIAMVLLTSADVTLRRLFNSPLSFSVELVEVWLTIVAAFSIAYTTSLGRHISIDILTMKFPPKVQAAIEKAMDLLSAVILGVIAWQCVVNMSLMQDAGETTGVLSVPLYPFALMIALGIVIACLLLLVRFVKSLTGEITK